MSFSLLFLKYSEWVGDNIQTRVPKSKTETVPIVATNAKEQALHLIPFLSYDSLAALKQRRLLPQILHINLLCLLRVSFLYKIVLYTICFLLNL